MKYFFISLLIICVTSIAFAENCPEIDLVRETIDRRNNAAQELYDDMMPDPRETIELLNGCLQIVNNLGAGFSLGVVLPSLDEILQSLCEVASDTINDKINGVLNSMKEELTGQFGFDSNFVINIDPDDISSELLSKIK